MKVHIKSWTSVAAWKWNLREQDDVCGICRNAFESTCPECKIPGDDCPLMMGKCSHVFHLHCILKWLADKQTCPLDRTPWENAQA